MFTIKLAFIPIIAGLGTLLLTPLVRKILIRYDIVDYPNHRKKHSIPVPASGGIAIFLGFMTTALLFTDLTIAIKGFLVGATLMAVMGFLDDVYDIPASVKMAGQIFIATLVTLFGIKIDFISSLNNIGTLDLGVLAIPLTIFWIVAITNAINLLDGLDGLAAGVVGISAITLGVVAMMLGQTGVAVLAFTLALSSFAFLPFNFSEKLKTFMGDSGSYFLGFSVAVLSILAQAKIATAFLMIIPIIILAVPIFDTAFVILKRLIRRRPITSADREHLHHRLVDVMGLGQREAVFFIYTLTILLSGIAIYSASLSTQTNITVYIISFVAIAISALAILNYHQRHKNGE